MYNIMKYILLYIFFLVNYSSCRDFYLGMFKKNDLLMSQDTLYKEKIAYRFTQAKYGRTYKCPITYVRVVDRLRIGRGPRIEIIRGGLQKKYIVLRLTSPYNNPISVNIYVGCQNKKFTNPPWKIIRKTTTNKASDSLTNDKTTAAGAEDMTTTPLPESTNTTVMASIESTIDTITTPSMENNTNTTAPSMEVTKEIENGTDTTVEPVAMRLRHKLSETKIVPEAVSEKLSKTVTKTETVVVTEAVTQALNYESTETLTETATDEVTKALTEALTETASDEVAKALIEEVTEALTETITDEVTKALTEAETQVATEDTISTTTTKVKARGPKIKKKRTPSNDHINSIN